MDLVLLFVAIASAIASGAGLALLVLPGRGRVIEQASLSVPLGFGFVSVASWLLGYMVSGPVLRGAVLIGCFAAFAWGVRRFLQGSRGPQGADAVPFSGPGGVYTRVFVLLALAHTAFIATLALTSELYWDGLVVWEFRGRITALSGGVIPLEYFTDASRAWSHPYYPPWYQMTVSWIYGWLGRPDQQLVKAIFPVLHAATLGILFAGSARLGGPRAGLAAVIVLMFVPDIAFADGGATSGYLDYSVASYYLPAAVYLALQWRGDRTALPPLAAVCAVLPLVKQEGIVVWAVIVTLSAVSAVRRRQARRLWMLLPGLVLFAAWRVHLQLAGTPPNVAFTPSPQQFLEHLDRVPVILREIRLELGNVKAWGLLWPAAALAVPGLLRRRRSDGVLLAALVSPVALLSASYVITNWDLMMHIEGSLPRLLMQVTPLAALVVALGIPFGEHGPMEGDGGGEVGAPGSAAATSGSG